MSMIHSNTRWLLVNSAIKIVVGNNVLKLTFFILKFMFEITLSFVRIKLMVKRQGQTGRLVNAEHFVSTLFLKSDLN